VAVGRGLHPSSDDISELVEMNEPSELDAGKLVTEDAAVRIELSTTVFVELYDTELEAITVLESRGVDDDIELS
jgi:hypothetical protein